MNPDPRRASAEERAAGAPASIAVEVERLTRRFGDVLALDHVSLSVRAGEFFSLLGPSGCGKTTLLRILAGLESADAGAVRIHGQDALALPPNRRPVNTVFQSYALFPHLSVWDNIAFGLRMKKTPRAEIDERVGRVMDMVEIRAMANRRPGQLSGGQKQRVALARAIVNEPKVLLLDEPLAALDLKLRKQLQGELRTLQRRLGITFIYVTHDQEEALVLSDRIAVMRDGRLDQVGHPQEVYDRPRTRFVCQFLGACNLIEARPVSGNPAPVNASPLQRPSPHIPVSGTSPESASISASKHGPSANASPPSPQPRSAQSPHNDAGLVVNTTVGALRIGINAGTVTAIPELSGESFALAIRPERVRLLGPGESDGPGENRIRARIEQVIYAGAETHYELRCGEQTLRAERMNDAPATGTALSPGAEAWVWLPPEALIVIED